MLLRSGRVPLNSWLPCPGSGCPHSPSKQRPKTALLHGEQEGSGMRSTPTTPAAARGRNQWILTGRKRQAWLWIHGCHVENAAPPPKPWRNLGPWRSPLGSKNFTCSPFFIDLVRCWYGAVSLFIFPPIHEPRAARGGLMIDSLPDKYKGASCPNPLARGIADRFDGI